MTTESTIREKQERELVGLDDIHRREVEDHGGNLEPDHDPTCSAHGFTALDDLKDLEKSMGGDRMADAVLNTLLNMGALPHLLAEQLAGFFYIVQEADAAVWMQIWDDAIASVEEHQRGEHDH